MPGGDARPGEGRPLADQVANAFRLAHERATFNRVFVYPPYLPQFWQEVRGLSRAGFELSMREEMRSNGKSIGARVVAPTGRILDFGDVLIDGAEGAVKIVQPLADVQTFVRFVDRATIAP